MAGPSVVPKSPSIAARSGLHPSPILNGVHKSPQMGAQDAPKSPSLTPKAPHIRQLSSMSSLIPADYGIRGDPIYDQIALSESISDDDELYTSEKDSRSSSDDISHTSSRRRVSFSTDADHHGDSLSNAGSGRKRGSSVGSHKRRTLVTEQPPSNIVTWAGIEDPQNPRNWPKHRKWMATVLVSSFTIMGPMASSMISPALGAIAGDLHVDTPIETTLIMAIFILGFAVGPLIFGPLSEVYGRVRVLQCTNLLFLFFNSACGFAQTKHEMLAYRFLSGVGASVASVIGGGIIGDCWWPEQRGRAIAAYNMLPLLGPSIGPIAGGFLIEKISWRCIFWVASLVDAFPLALSLCFLQETFSPMMLERKARMLRRETGNTKLRTEHERPGNNLAKHLAINVGRPIRMLCTQPIIMFMAAYVAFIYGMTFLIYATYSDLFTNHYGQKSSIACVHYITLSVGFAIGTQFICPLNDRIYAILKRKDGGQGRPEFRILLMVLGTILVAAGILCYGWCARAHTHWIGPDIGIAVFACGCDICFQCINAYVIEAYGSYSASALAALIFLRSIAGCDFPFLAPIMDTHLGYGWTATVVAGLALFGLPAPFVLWCIGPKLRKRSSYQADEMKQ